MLEGIFCTPCG